MIYLQIEGIKGNVTAEGYKDWIQLDSLQYGVDRAVGMSTGAGRERETGAPSLSEISVTKQMDESSGHLFQEACSGTAKKVAINVVRTSSDKVQEYLKLELENCLVSRYNVSSGGELPSESLSLAFTKITMSFTHWDKSNKPGNPIVVSYDLETAKKG